MFTVFAAAMALATPHRVVLDHDDPTPDEYDALLEQASSSAPAGATSVELWGPSGRILPRTPTPPPAKSPRRSAVDHIGRSQGALTGKAVYLSQCHGFIWYETLNAFSTQRGNLFSTVEDFHNPEGMNHFLANYLENAGARVFTTKERDHNPNLAIADNDGTGYTEVGSGFSNGAAGFSEAQASWAYGDNPFDSGTTRSFAADGGGIARWKPTVPEDGSYHVYVSWDANSGNATDAHYKIKHPGGVVNRHFDQTVHGSTWQYVETLWLTAGKSLTVELIGDSTQSKTLSADAVRIGGGMGDVSRHGYTTGEPRWSEGAILYTQYNGAPRSVYDPYSDGDGSDPTSRSRWAAWEHPNGEDAVYLSWHSNAASGTARGTVTYYAGSQCSSPAVTGSYDLSASVQDEMVTQFQSLWETGWYDRGVATACFSEVNPNNNGEMPSALVELAFHDNATDIEFLKHPQFRRDAARGMYRGIVRYFAERDNRVPVFLPEPPTHLAVVHAGDGLKVSWKPGPKGTPFGDAPDSYLLQTSPDGRAWDNGSSVSGTSTKLKVDPGTLVFVRVSAVNDGGVSFPSEVAGARLSPEGHAPVLVVNAFDRLDTGMLQDTDVGGRSGVNNIGTVKRLRLSRMNDGTIIVPHGQAIADAGWYFDSATDEAADFGGYDLVVWATGEESTVDESFSDAQQAAIEAFLDDGGALWTSGAEILWDLDNRGDSGDQDFAANVLGATMNSDAAGSNQVSGVDILADVGPMDFGITHGGPYPVEWPDTLTSSRTVIATYGSGETAGVLGRKVAMFGFPFDAIADSEVRAEVAAALLPALVAGYEPPDPDVKDEDDPGKDGQVDADPYGTNDKRERLGEGGCGCQAAPGPSGWIVWIGLLGWMRRAAASRS